jgi:threonine dehydrogenase-like Zn-dependent dehydrogenase
MTDHQSIVAWKTRSPTPEISTCRSNRWVPDKISMRPWLTTLTRSAIATMSSSASITNDMKCVFYGDLNKVQTIPVPKHKPGHLLVQVKAVGLNPVDAKDVFGHAVVRWYIKDKIPGFDFAGVVVASSSSGATDEYQPGDKVYGTMPPFTGSLAEYVDAPLDQVCHMPENFSFEEAAATPLVW